QKDYGALLKTTGGKERITRYVTEIGGDISVAEVAVLHAFKSQHYVALMAAGEIALRPGIADLMAEARASGVRMAVATTTSLPNVEALSRAVFGKSADQVFEVIVGGDMVSAKKPAPDVYLLALHQLGLTARQAVALEDSRNGLRSAKAAALSCVVSPGIYTLDEDFGAADRIVGCFTDLGGLKGLQDMARGKAAKWRL
ncbi:MAG: HAD-IA family hydrolase, partial [Paracoccaceae bacterium]